MPSLRPLLRALEIELEVAGSCLPKLVLGGVVEIVVLQAGEKGANGEVKSSRAGNNAQVRQWGAHEAKNVRGGAAQTQYHAQPSHWT